MSRFGSVRHIPKISVRFAILPRFCRDFTEIYRTEPTHQTGTNGKLAMGQGHRIKWIPPREYTIIYNIYTRPLAHYRNLPVPPGPPRGLQGPPVPPCQRHHNEKYTYARRASKKKYTRWATEKYARLAKKIYLASHRAANLPRISANRPKNLGSVRRKLGCQNLGKSRFGKIRKISASLGSAPKKKKNLGLVRFG